MPVAEHHDGFQMYESSLSKWNAGQLGPKKDIIGELKAAVEAEEMTIRDSIEISAQIKPDDKPVVLKITID